VNFLKSRIDGVGVDQIMIQRFAKILNCDMMKTPFKYLGMLEVGVTREVHFGMKW